MRSIIKRMEIVYALLFYKPEKGCLDGKTPEEKERYFRSLAQFAIDDPVFFEEQYADLLPHEQSQFNNWVIQRTENLNHIKALVNAIEILLKEEHSKTPLK